jgi:hypothetical protein
MGYLSTYNASDFGSYQFTSLENIITQFQIAYVGENKLIPKLKKADVSFHAMRALQELSFDTFKSCKSREITVGNSLQMMLPEDYVNYVKLTWSDSAGIEHILYPATKTSNPTPQQEFVYSDAVVPYGLSFDGDDDFLSITYNFTSVFRGSFTISFWVKAQNGQGSGNQYFMGSGETTVINSDMFRFYIDSTGKINFLMTANIQRDIGANSADYLTLSTTNPVFDAGVNDWKHVVFTAERTGTGTTLAMVTAKIYVNGSLASDSQSGAVGQLLESSQLSFIATSPMYIGAYNHTLGASQHFNGDMDEFAVWNTALSASEISTVYNSGSPFALETDISGYSKSSNLEVYYKFNEGSGINVGDSSGNSRDGTISAGGAPTWIGGLSSSLVDGSSILLNTESKTWQNYKSTTPSENNNNDYEDDTYWRVNGERYGLDPQHAQVNGSYYIDCASGAIHFSSNLSGKIVILKYISDGIGTDREMVVHKFAEEAMYKYIIHAIMSTSSYGQALVPRLTKEKFAAIRKAKLRLSNIKLEEITQILRGKSKQIKH